jgi:hypothetical protein
MQPSRSRCVQQSFQGEDRAMVQGNRRIAAGLLRPLVIGLLAPAIVAASAAILLSLLGIFVVWLGIVGAILTAIVAADCARGSLRRLAPTLLAMLERPAVGVPR